MSVRDLTRDNLSAVLFVEDKVMLLGTCPTFSHKDVRMTGKIDETGLYAISKSIDHEGIIHANSTKISNPLTLEEWHVRLGHMPKSRIIELINNGILDISYIRR